MCSNCINKLSSLLISLLGNYEFEPTEETKNLIVETLGVLVEKLQETIFVEVLINGLTVKELESKIDMRNLRVLVDLFNQETVDKINAEFPSFKPLDDTRDIFFN